MSKKVSCSSSSCSSSSCSSKPQLSDNKAQAQAQAPDLKDQLTITDATIKRLKVHEITGFSPIEFNDEVIFHGALTSVDGSAITLDSAAINIISVPSISSASSGSASSLPSTPAGYLPIQLDGVNYRIPYYNPSS